MRALLFSLSKTLLPVSIVVSAHAAAFLWIKGLPSTPSSHSSQYARVRLVDAKETESQKAEAHHASSAHRKPLSNSSKQVQKFRQPITPIGAQDKAASAGAVVQVGREKSFECDGNFEAVIDDVAKVYPLVARQRKWQGSALVEFAVSKDGRIEDVFLQESSGYAVLDEEAVRAVTTARASPACEDGAFVKSQLTRRIEFKLTQRSID